MLKFLSWLALISTFLLINLGGFVHNTGASLACPDWPLCYGQIMPKMEGGILIEHSHRMLASWVGLLAILTVIFSWRNSNIKLKKHAIFNLVLVIFQGVLGGLTVIYKLPTIISTAHLATSMLFFLSLLLFHLKLSHRKRVLPSNFNMNYVFVTGFAAFAVFLQMILGAFIRHSGLGGVCGSDWTSSLICMDIIAWEKTWFPLSSQAQMHMGHRYFGALIGLVILALVFHMKNNLKRLPMSYALSALLVIVQILLGVATVGTNLGVWQTTLHLSFAALLFLSLCYGYFTSKEVIRELGQSTHCFFSDLLSLIKPRLSALVIFSAMLGLFLAPGEISFFTSIVTIFGTSMVVAGACALNCFIERDVDALMKRTADRPLPAKRMQPRWAFGLGFSLVLVSTSLLYIFVNDLVATMGVIATLLYLFVYTPLKRISPAALFVGAIPGAIPPMMGWASVTGQLDVSAWILFAILFVWQLPHFLSISMVYDLDYKNAGILVHANTKGFRFAKVRIVFYTLLLMYVATLPLYLGEASQKYHVIAISLSVVFLLIAMWGLLQKGEKQKDQIWAKRYFYGSIIYLPMILMTLVIFR